VGKFRNVIVCEDIRDEVGGKRSLMGVFPGDIVAPAFPARLQISVYIEYVGDEGESGELSLGFRFLMNDIEVAKGIGIIPLLPNHVGLLIVPKGIISTPNPAAFRILVSLNDGPDEELISKKILQGDVTSLPTATSQP
jgi:hypothetical protein